MAVAVESPLKPPENENAARIVWALAWPAVALNSMQVVNTLLDRFFIGQLPAAALTAHSGSMNVMFLMFSLAMALGTSATAIVSRAYGAGKSEELRQASRQSISIALLAGAAMAVLGWLLAPLFAHALLPKDNAAAIRYMIEFLASYMLGLPAIYLIQSLAGSLRGVGDTKSPMVISGIQIILHILLNLVFILPPRPIGGGFVIPGLGLGLVGAGLALSLSAWIAAIIYLGYSGRTAIGATWKIVLPAWSWTVRLLKIALPAALNAVLRVGSLAAFTIVLASIPASIVTAQRAAATGSTLFLPGFGSVAGIAMPITESSAAIAAMGVAFAIESIMFMPSFGLSIAASALVGQSLGMGRPDRAERLGWVAGHHSAIVTALLALPIFIAAPHIAHVMLGGKTEIVAASTELIRWLCVTEILFAYSMTMIGAMQGAGDTVRPLWITILTMWCIRVPLAWLLTLPLGMGATGAWIAMSSTQAIQGVASMYLFAGGKWKHKKV